MSVHDYRLTAADESAITARLAQTKAEWAANGCQLVGITGANYPTLLRIACHAIGCTTHDMRDVELAWIDDAIAALVEP